MVHTVLIAAADTAVLAELRQHLVAQGYLVRTARDGHEALDRLRTAPVDAVVAVAPLPVVDVVALVEGLRRGGDATPVVVAGEPGEADRRLPGVRVLPGPVASPALLVALLASLEAVRR